MIVNPVEKTNYIRTVLQFYLLLFITALIIYFSPKSLAATYLILTLILYFRSRNDLFWFAFAFTITFDIGGIFYSQTSQIFAFTKLDLSYLWFFSIISFFKYLLVPRFRLGFLARYYKIYGLYFFVLIFAGIFVFGIVGGGNSGFRYIIYILKFLPYTALVISIPIIFNCFNNIMKFSAIMIGLLPLNLIGQIFHIVSGMPLYEKYGIVAEDLVITLDSANALRPEWGFHIRYIAMIMAIFIYHLNEKRQNTNNKVWLIIFILLSFFSTLLTATRGYILAFSFVLVSVIIFNLLVSKRSKLFISGICGIIFILSLSSLFNPFKLQLQRSVNRLASLEAIFKGDPTLEGTNARLTTRHDAIMSIFYKHPIFGVGVSATGLEGFDQHTGNQSILATGGITEFCIFIGMIFFFITATVRVNRKLLAQNVFKKNILLFNIFLVGLLIVHSTSTYIFSIVGWIKYSGAFIFILVFLSIYNQVLTMALIENNKLLNHS